MKILKNLLLVIASVILLTTCSADNILNSYQNVKIIEEAEVMEIPLEGEIAERKSEISGLCWYDDNLILLPQYPNRFTVNGLGKIFFIAKEKIDNYLEHKSTLPITAEYYTIDLKGFADLFNIGSGFEAVTTKNDTLYFSIESLNNGNTETFLIKGIINEKLRKIILDNSSLTLAQSNLHINNLSDETIVYVDDKIIPIYEANGKNINPHPNVNEFSSKLKFIRKLNFPSIEYRITDATSANKDGKFWVMNYLYPGDIEKLKVGEDNLIRKYGLGKSRLKSKAIERLLELKYTTDGIKLTNRAPIYLQLLNDDSRNWEGLVNYNGQLKGFIIATDTFPKTILAFVKYK